MPESPVQTALNVLGQAIDENTDRSVAAVDAATVALERSADAIHASGQALAGVAGVKTALDALSLRVAALEQGSVPVPPEPPAGEMQTVVLTETHDLFLNPERGFHVNWGNPNGIRQAGYTLNRMYNRLDAFRNGPISAAHLNAMRQTLQAHRDARVGLVWRHAYNFDQGQPDAPENRILQHIEQLAPIWREFQDVIAVLQAGFIGAWGEWHSSTNGLTEWNSAGVQRRQRIGNALLDAFPGMVQFRYPVHLRELFGGGLTFPGFDNSRRARAGTKNDSFSVNQSNGGTFSFDQGVTRGVLDRDTFEAYGWHAAVGGETSGVSWGSGGPRAWANGDGRGGQGANYGAFVLRELERFSYDYLNAEFHQGTLDLWKNQNPVIYPEANRRLGYRLVMQEVEAPLRVQRGQQATVRVRMANRGTGKVYNPRPLQLLLGQHRVTITEDGRSSLPLAGQTVDVELAFRVPDLASGQYPLRLALPDRHHPADPLLAIRTANPGWNNGTNDLRLSLSVA